MPAFSYRIPANALSFNGVVYFFAAERENKRLIKIGHSIKDRTRIYQLRSDYQGEIIALVAGGLIEEYVCHRLFEKDRVVGEWFEPSAQLLRFVEHRKFEGSLPNTAQDIADKFREGCQLVIEAANSIQHARNMGEL